MARIFGYILALATVSISIYHAQGAPIESRQIGDIACNVARLKTVAGLAATTNALKKLGASAAGDAATTSAVTSAQSDIASASNGIKTIAGALLTGKGAPADARDQVSQGLLAAQTALSGINSTNPTVESLLSTVQGKLQGTITAGNDVVSQCGGSGSSSSAADNSDSGDDTNNVDGSGSSSSSVASLSGRQIGDVSCNVARLQTVTRLAASSAAVQEVTKAATGDSTTLAAAGKAQAALSSAEAAIGKIAVAIVTLQQAPAADREQVQSGLTDAQNSLASITSTSSAVTSAVANAQKELQSTQTAGDAVVSNC